MAFHRFGGFERIEILRRDNKLYLEVDIDFLPVLKSSLVFSSIGGIPFLVSSDNFNMALKRVGLFIILFVILSGLYYAALLGVIIVVYLHSRKLTS